MIAGTEQSQFDIQKVVAKNMLKSFPIGPSATKVGIIVYGDRTYTTPIKFGKLNTKENVNKRLSSLQTLTKGSQIKPGSSTDSITSVLKVVDKSLNDQANPDRPGVLKTLVLFAPSNVVIPAAELKKLRNTQVVILKLAPLPPKTGDGSVDDDKEDIEFMVVPVPSVDPGKQDTDDDLVTVEVKPNKPEINPDNGLNVDVKKIIDAITKGIFFREISFNKSIFQ
jgi:von Willebrand factor type A domain.